MTNDDTDLKFDPDVTNTFTILNIERGNFSDGARSQAEI